MGYLPEAPIPRPDRKRSSPSPPSEAADSSHRPKVERRAYRCPDCHAWHLTSRP